MARGTKATAAPRSLLRKPCECRCGGSPRERAPRPSSSSSSPPTTPLTESVICPFTHPAIRFFVFFPLPLTTRSASKRSRRTRRYATIIRTSLRRARTSTATARNCSKTRAARGGPAFTSTACLLCDTSSSRALAAPLPPTQPPHPSSQCDSRPVSPAEQTALFYVNQTLSTF